MWCGWNESQGGRDFIIPFLNCSECHRLYKFHLFKKNWNGNNSSGSFCLELICTKTTMKKIHKIEGNTFKQESQLYSVFYCHKLRTKKDTREIIDLHKYTRWNTHTQFYAGLPGCSFECLGFVIFRELILFDSKYDFDNVFLSTVVTFILG